MKECGWYAWKKKARKKRKKEKFADMNDRRYDLGAVRKVWQKVRRLDDREGMPGGPKSRDDERCEWVTPT